MMGSMIEMIVELLPVFIILVFIAYAIKLLKSLTGGKKKKTRDVKTMSERIYNMLASNAKSSGLKKLTKVYVRGDEDVPKHRVGTTIGGVLNFQEYIIVPIKKRWWNPLEKARMLMVEGEAVSDLHEGDLVIEGSSIHPITEKFTWVVPSKEMVDKYGDDEIQEKREAFMEKVFNQLGSFDLNNDMWANTKTAIRGNRASSKKEQIATNVPDIREEQTVERESRREQKRVEREEEKDKFNKGGGL